MTDKHPMRILSGIQPSGVLHIGNYFGMMRPAIALQDEGEALYFIADYHALTSLRDPIALLENSRRVALDFLACGLNPEKAARKRVMSIVTDSTPVGAPKNPDTSTIMQLYALVASKDEIEEMREQF